MRRVQRDVLDKHPTVVVIYIGTNDVWHQMQGGGVKAEHYENDLLKLIDRLEASGARVVLCTPAVIGEARKNVLDELLDRYSDIVRKIVDERKLALVDLRQACKQYLAEHNKMDREFGILTTMGFI